MSQWLKANGGPLALVVVGIGLTGFTNRYAGGALILIGVVAFVLVRRRPSPDEQEQPETQPYVPRPDIRIFDLHPEGGGGGYVDFAFNVANYGTQTCRTQVRAAVGGQDVNCVPALLELIPNAPQQRVRVIVPRPGLGELVDAFAGETTLYGETLTVDVEAETSPEIRAQASWSEKLYLPDENAARWEIQQREWRIGKGTQTPEDDRADMISRMRARRDERLNDV